ncbi:MAG: electron transport complex subunit RsxC [Ruminococcaceae bacterium]|nr:electron transport complex subunit RsxC [Oscillospiraceae bacterium]
MEERCINMAFYLPGIHTPHRKHTEKSPVVRMDIPKTVTIPMSMHIGAPAKPIVKVGALVKVGTKIGEAVGGLSSNVYSSVSGKVTKLADFLLSNGATTTAVVIESDGEMTPDETLAPPIVNNRQELIAALMDSGIVGLGGAGFPTQVKLDVDPARIEYLIINGAECEPYVTSDTVTMMTRADDMSFALKELARCLGIKQVIIGIEDNKKDAIANMNAMASSVKECDVSVKVLPAKYPQGGEKVLIYHTTGRKILLGKLPIDVGCIVLNCTTLAAIGTYLKTGMPLTEKCVTVDGGAVNQPQNVIAPIGASMQDLFDFCGGLTEDPAKLIYGGPMMGVTVQNTAAPVLKNTNAVLALTAKEAKLPKTTACIRCGACVNTCPFGLAPASIADAFSKKDAGELTALSVDSCMECGCCSYVCPANRPLVQINKLSKQFLKEERKKEANKA